MCWITFPSSFQSFTKSFFCSLNDLVYFVLLCYIFLYKYIENTFFSILYTLILLLSLLLLVEISIFFGEVLKKYIKNYIKKSSRIFYCYYITLKGDFYYTINGWSKSYEKDQRVLFFSNKWVNRFRRRKSIIIEEEDILTRWRYT